MSQTTQSKSIWTVKVGGATVAFDNQDAAENAADIIESHVGILTKPVEVPLYEGKVDLKELIRVFPPKSR